MQKSPIFLLLIVVFSAELAFSQQLSPVVVSPSGGFYTSVSGTLSFTTGEMTAVETHVTPSVILTQGFQQPWDFGTAVHGPAGTDFTFSIYPNPSTGHFYISTESGKGCDVVIRIYDVLGSELYRHTYTHVAGKNTQFIDLQNVSSGLYLVAVDYSQYNQVYRLIQKVEILN